MKNFLAVSLLIILLSPALASAADFNKNFVISDEEMFDTNSMSLGEIQKFFESRGSGLTNYLALDVDGAFRTAAEVIWRAATTFNLNPKFLLVLIQKEQSLVEDKTVTQYQLDWATGFSRCDNCSANHPDLQGKKGFAQQVYYAAQRIREKYVADIETKGKTVTGFGQGVSKIVDRRVKVTPKNKATAILYTYTPHIAGNKHFWQIWNRWFSPLYPDGTLLQEKETGGIWLIENGLRRPFLSKAAFYSRYDADNVIQVSKDDLGRYEQGQPIKFSNYSLLRLADGTMYLVAGNTKRLIASKEVMRVLGYRPDELIEATPDDLVLLEDGEPITQKTVYPLGALLQDIKTGGVFFVVDGRSRPIVDKQLFNLYFKGRKVIKVNKAQLAKFENSDPVRFKDGEIVGWKKTGEIYIISNGERRPITKEVLQSLGFDSARIIWTSEKLLVLHIIGAPVIYTTTIADSFATTDSTNVNLASDVTDETASSTDSNLTVVEASNTEPEATP